eukprot:s481_g18.t1
MAEDADAASSQVLRVWTASGKELAALPVEEFGTVKALKRHLQSLCGLPRFQQRLLHEGTDLDDDFRFAGSLNLQLVLLTLSDSFPDCVALQRCCYEGSAAEAERILKIPQDPNCQAPGSLGGPLDAAACAGRLETMRLLLEARADMEHRGVFGETPLSVACAMGQLSAAKILVAEGANMEVKRVGGQTPLWAACQNGRVSIIRMLLKARAHIDALDDLGMTPLATACHWGRPRAARLLLQARADKELADTSGTTPLGTACRCGQLPIVHLLLEALANAAARDNLGRTCLKLASGSHGLAIRYLISTRKWSRRLQKKRRKIFQAKKP